MLCDVDEVDLALLYTSFGKTSSITLFVELLSND